MKVASDGVIEVVIAPPASHDMAPGKEPNEWDSANPSVAEVRTRLHRPAWKASVLFPASRFPAHYPSPVYRRSPEFMDAHALAMGKAPDGSSIGAKNTHPGTINALAVHYYQTEAWNRLTPDTQKTRKRIIERVPCRARQQARRDAPARPHRQHDDEDREADGPASLAYGHFRVAGGSGAAHAEGQSCHRHRACSAFRRAGAITLGPTTRSRSIASIGPSALSSACDGVRAWRRHPGAAKSSCSARSMSTRDASICSSAPTGGDVDIPMYPELQAACEAMPKAHLTYIVTAYGKPRSEMGWAMILPNG